MFTERLKALRKETGLTQSQLAKIIGTTQQNIGFWETGRQKPKQHSLSQLASYFNVSADYLLGNTDIKNPAIIDEDKLDEALDEALGLNKKTMTSVEKEIIHKAITLYLSKLKK